MIYGYARVSTDGQSVDAQVKALHAAGAEKVIRETASGTKSDRVGLRRLLDGLDAPEARLDKIEPIDEGVDEADGVVGADVIVHRFWQQQELVASET